MRSSLWYIRRVHKSGSHRMHIQRSVNARFLVLWNITYTVWHGCGKLLAAEDARPGLNQARNLLLNKLPHSMFRSHSHCYRNRCNNVHLTNRIPERHCSTNRWNPHKENQFCWQEQLEFGENDRCNFVRLVHLDSGIVPCWWSSHPILPKRRYCYNKPVSHWRERCLRSENDRCNFVRLVHLDSGIVPCWWSSHPILPKRRYCYNKPVSHWRERCLC